jgi:hypothetical protein
MKINKLQLLFISLNIFILTFFLLNDMSNIFGSYFFTFILFYPPFLLSLNTNLIYLKLITFLSFITQLITVPLFFIFKDDFSFIDIKPFKYTSIDTLNLLMKPALFIYFICIFSILFSSVIKNNINVRKIPCNNFVFKDKIHQRIQSKGIYSIILLIIVITLIPLHVWMFSNSVGMVGVNPPSLPFKISGILHYFTKLFIPLIIGYLYYKSNKNYFISFVLLLYGILLGLTTLSRSSFLMISVTMLIFSFIDNKKLKIIILSFGTIVGASVITVIRDTIYSLFGNEVVANTSGGVSQVLINLFENTDIQIFNGTFLLKNFQGIFGRIEGFGNLIMANYYDLTKVGKPIQFITLLIWHGISPLNTDLHHIQWQGNTLPEGFYNGGAILSNSVIVGNFNLFLLILSSLVVVFMLYLMEKNINFIIKYFKLPILLNAAIIFFFTTIYFIDNGGSDLFFYSFLLIVITSFILRFKLKII